MVWVGINRIYQFKRRKKRLYQLILKRIYRSQNLEKIKIMSIMNSLLLKDKLKNLLWKLHKNRLTMITRSEKMNQRTHISIQMRKHRSRKNKIFMLCCKKKWKNRMGIKRKMWEVRLSKLKNQIRFLHNMKKTQNSYNALRGVEECSMKKQSKSMKRCVKRYF